MKNIFVQLLILVLLFFGAWFSLRQIDWMKNFNIAQKTTSTEEKLGDLIWESFAASETEIKDPKITKPLDSIVTRICKSNKIDRTKIKLHILNNTEVNAFALPNQHLVIYTGLIKESRNEDELSGVISHELAHIELNHVMKRLVNELGLTVLLTLTGGSGNEVIKEIIHLLTASAYDRSLETEADTQAVEYMITAGLHPDALADFLYRLLNNTQNELADKLVWISTHPASDERAETIIELARDRKIIFKPILSKQGWTALQSRIETID